MRAVNLVPDADATGEQSDATARPAGADWQGTGPSGARRWHWLVLAVCVIAQAGLFVGYLIAAAFLPGGEVWLDVPARLTIGFIAATAVVAVGLAFLRRWVTPRYLALGASAAQALVSRATTTAVECERRLMAVSFCERVLKVGTRPWRGMPPEDLSCWFATRASRWDGRTPLPRIQSIGHDARPPTTGAMRSTAPRAARTARWTRVPGPTVRDGTRERRPMAGTRRWTGTPRGALPGLCARWQIRGPDRR